jgi:hypothetical protein
VTEGDEEYELIRRMNAVLRGSDQALDYQAVEPQVARLWELFDEARAQSSPVRLRARIDTGMQELLSSRPQVATVH